MAEEIGGVGALAARRDHRVAVRGDALGRFWWPWWSDIAGRPWVLTAKFVFQRLIARAGAVALAREDARLPRRITDTRNELVHSA